MVSLDRALAEKVCVVTGGGSGIGRQSALEMLRWGAEAVVVADPNVEASDETVSMATTLGWSAMSVPTDVADSASVEALMGTVEDRFGRLDVLHNNAGIIDGQLIEEPTLEFLPEEVWDRIFDVNVKGSWLCTKCGVPLMRRAKRPAIVNCSSVSALLAVDGEPAYSSSKAAIIQLTRNTAAEFASDGIRCNCYSPASIATPMTAPLARDSAAVTRVTSRYLVERLGQPVDVAQLVCFLASDLASFITGCNVNIDGGLTAWRGSRSS